MPFKLFELLARFLIGAFLITLTRLEKTGSTGKVFIPLKTVMSIPYEKYLNLRILDITKHYANCAKLQYNTMEKVKPT